MKVEVLSKTVQRFNGVSYYKCGDYYQRKGVRLHRVVWEYHNGEIPKGYHIHHIDGDRSNNDIDNLTLLSEHDHLSMHMSKEERKEQSREDIHKAIEAAAKWHGTKEGIEWHSKHAKEYWDNAPMQTYTCTWCGEEFQTRNVSYKGSHFCCANHKAAALRWRRKHEGQKNYPCRKG